MKKQTVCLLMTIALTLLASGCSSALTEDSTTDFETDYLVKVEAIPESDGAADKTSSKEKNTSSGSSTV